MTRRIVVSVILVGVLLAVGALVSRGLVALRRQPVSIDPARAPLTVNAVRLEPLTVIATLEGFGTARADRRADLGTEVSGRVVALADGLRDGVAVKSGAILVQIDDREYNAQLRRARSQLANERAALAQIDVEQRTLEGMIKTAAEELEVAEREYARIRNLLESGTSSERELDTARVVVQRARRTLQDLERQLAVIPDRRAQQQATCELREAEVALAQLNVERCEIKAPFDGRVEQVRIELGERVAPGQTLLSLVDPGLIEIPVELPVSQRESVRAGSPARLWLESNPEVAWTGRVARVAPSADALTRTFSLFLEVENPNPDSGFGAGQPPLMPGMFVEAEIDGPTLTDALIVPRGSVRRQQVFVCEDGKAYARPVGVEHHLRERTVISGLKPGDIVITSNLDALHDGQLVDPVFATAESATAPPQAAGADAEGTAGTP